MSTNGEDSPETRARAAIAAAGLAADPSGAEIEPVAGLTNLVFRVGTPERHFWLRLPGPHSAAYLDRAAEAHNARAAAEAGVTPALIHAGADGTMATEFVEGARPLPELGLISHDSLRLIASCFRRLHHLAAPFRGTFDALGSAHRYLARHPRTGRIAERMAAIIERMRETKAALDDGSVPLAPCHCDPVPENVLVGRDRALLLDWEYAGMADPLWDLAYFASTAALPATGEALLLHAYLGRSANDAEHARIALHKAEAAGLAAAWAFMREADSSGSAAARFGAYAEASLTEAEARFGAKDFSAMLELARRG
jgi:thiamine kinase-like enzyme